MLSKEEALGRQAGERPDLHCQRFSCEQRKIQVAADQDAAVCGLFSKQLVDNRIAVNAGANQTR